MLISDGRIAPSSASTLETITTTLESGPFAGVVQWQNGSFPSFIRGFDSLHPLHLSTSV